MTLLPLQVVSFEEGVPIPNNIFNFKMTKSQIESFEVEPVELQDSTTIEHAFLLGISVLDSLNLNLTTSAEELVETITFVGTLCELIKVSESDEYIYNVECLVYARANLDTIDGTQNPLKCGVHIIDDILLPGEEELLTDMRSLIKLLLVNENVLSIEITKQIAITNDILIISNILATSLNLSNKDKLRYLQSNDTLDRFTIVLQNLIRTLDKTSSQGSSIGKLIDPFSLETSKPKKTSRSKRKPVTSSLEDKLKLVKNAPQEVLDKVQRETSRLSSLPTGSLEYQTLYEYLTWVSEIPWGVTTNKQVELTTLIDELSKTHYGLDDAKEHILEYLTIEHITGSTKGTVMCFAGPPGTGKTTLAKQIAHACNRKLIRIALGGLSDESELRGHRKTYVSAYPGRLAKGLKDAKAMDPLFLLDEVDKLDMKRGDPTAALLEILDPEQNDAFIDRYLELPVDLSKAMFICTANYLDMVPEPLLDRFEIIEFREYTLEEREIILQSFMVDKWIREYGLADFDITIQEEAYPVFCQPTGVRNIERTLKKLLRKAAVSIVVNHEDKVIITAEDVEKVSKQQSKTKIGFSAG